VNDRLAGSAASSLARKAQVGRRTGRQPRTRSSLGCLRPSALLRAKPVDDHRFIRVSNRKQMRLLRVWIVLLVIHLFTCSLYADRRRAVMPATRPDLFRISQPIDGVAAIAAAPDGSVWFAPDFLTPDFIGLLSPAGVLTTFPIHASPIFMSVDAAGSLWFAAGSLVRIEGDSIVQFPTNRDITGFAIDDRGRPWFTDATANEVGFLRPSDGTITHFDLPESVRNPSYIQQGPDGKMWFVASNGIIASITSDGIFEQHSFPALAGKPISAVSASADGFWLSLDRRECNRFSCPYPDDHGTVVLITADYTIRIVADLGINNIFALAAGKNGTVYALEAIYTSFGSFAGPVLRIRSTGMVDQFQTFVMPSLPLVGGLLSATPEGTLWGVYLGGGWGPIFFRFPAWQIQ
jgi:hypothetical protein